MFQNIDSSLKKHLFFSYVWCYRPIMVCFQSINQLICDLLTVIYTQLACRGTDRSRTISVCQCANASKYLSGKEERIVREYVCIIEDELVKEGEEQRDVLCFSHAVFLLSVTVNSERLDATEHFLDWYLLIYTLSVLSKRLSVCPTPPTLLPSAFSTYAFPPRFSVLLTRSVLQTAGWDGTGLSLLVSSSLFILLLITCCSPLISFTFSLSHALLQGLGACDVFTPRIIIVIFFLCVFFE